jgi:hypothetical protein
MDDVFFPFIYEKKDQLEPLPLYIELTPPSLEDNYPIKEEKEEPTVIIIDLF